MAAQIVAENVEALKATYKPNAEFQQNAHVASMERYKEMYQLSIENPGKFWGDIAKEFYWKSPPQGEALKYNFNVNQGKIDIKWFEDGVTNICYNVLDRNVKDRGLGDQIAFYWEGNDPDDSAKYTYAELLTLVCKFSNVLKSIGVKKGDRVAIYMPMIIELVVAMLACARIGAVHSIVFGGFSSDSLAGRILDASCEVIITADGVYRGTKLLNLKEIADGAISKCKEQGFTIRKCVVARHLGPADVNGQGDKTSSPVAKRPCRNLSTSWNNDIDIWWHEVMAESSDQCEPEWMGAEDPLFMLYTSGSTGKPKGVLHTTGGYMLYTATTFKYVFNYHPGDVYHCTADIGWITGHSYIVYGPMANAATSVIFEGVPTYPDAGRFWQYVDKYQITQFYTAPTAIRSLMKFGDSFVTKCSRKSLKVIGTVGEPINPEAWVWYHRVVGDKRCPIVDTYWQTETGGHVMTPLPGCTPAKPGAACFPFFGVVPAIVDETGKEIDGPGEGYMVFKQPWPGIMRTVYGDHERFEKTYFAKFPGYYVTGDGCKRDADGYYWITGRIDDMLNVSGHLLSTAEIESALDEHASVAEAAVVSHPHKVKGEATYCFVTLKDGAEFNAAIVKELKEQVRSKIGPFAQPDVIQNAPALPKTRSGKIMRRVLRKIATNDRSFGDITTLADPSIVEQLFEERPKLE